MKGAHDAHLVLGDVQASRYKTSKRRRNINKFNSLNICLDKGNYTKRTQIRSSKQMTLENSGKASTTKG
ncbi:AKR_collapsed_G0047330.mRNA.1.CDS.1 [Saccharomyces cerevisiae]|nr:AKR_collapsed_G0047330.mRNA.1.CDS.1 [Saccharomyces cerevisiae]